MESKPLNFYVLICLKNDKVLFGLTALIPLFQSFRNNIHYSYYFGVVSRGNLATVKTYELSDISIQFTKWPAPRGLIHDYSRLEARPTPIRERNKTLLKIYDYVKPIFGPHPKILYKSEEKSHRVTPLSKKSG